MVWGGGGGKTYRSLRYHQGANQIVHTLYNVGEILAGFV